MVLEVEPMKTDCKDLIKQLGTDSATRMLAFGPYRPEQKLCSAFDPYSCGPRQHYSIQVVEVSSRWRNPEINDHTAFDLYDYLNSPYNPSPMNT